MNTENYQKAAAIHTRIRKDLETDNILKPGVLLIDICRYIEHKIRHYSENTEINGGIAFPVGISNNNIVAHYSPSDKDLDILKPDDVCSIDYGVHVNGHIIDSAFTINLSNKYQNLLEASHHAVKETLKNIGVDVLLNELSENIHEIVSSYEIEENGKLIPIKAIDNVCGHNILPWIIHGGKTIYAQPEETQENKRVEVNDVFAVEVFTSTGKGSSVLDMNIKNHSHYMLKSSYKDKRIPLFSNSKTNKLTEIIKQNFNTLAFCPRFINYNTGEKTTYTRNLHELFDYEIINSYPPLLESGGEKGKVAQYEHTIMIREEGNIVFTENPYY